SSRTNTGSRRSNRISHHFGKVATGRFYNRDSARCSGLLQAFIPQAASGGEISMLRKFFPLTSEVTKFVISRKSGAVKSCKYMYLKTITDGQRIATYDDMLKILRFDGNGFTTFALSGDIEGSDLQALQDVLDAEPETANLTLDLQEVRLVYREGVR